MTPSGFRRLLPTLVLAASAAVFASPQSRQRTAQGLAFVPFFFLGRIRGRDPRREAEEQAAFEEAERLRAENRAGVVFDGFIDSSPVSIELFRPDGTPQRSNKAAERLLGKVPPPGISLFDPRGLKRAGLLEPQLKRVLAGARVETPPTWYDPTEIGLPGMPGRKICFRATVYPLFDHEGKLTRIAVMHEDLTELKRMEQAQRDAEQRTRVAAPPLTEAAGMLSGASGDARDIEFQRRKIEQALREAEERYRSFIESAKGCVILRFSEDGHILAVSPSIAEYWGIKHETIIVDNAAYFSRIHPDDLARVKATEAEARKSGGYPKGYQFRVINIIGGTVHWFEARGSVSAYAGRKTLDTLLIDITAQKALESALADREQRLAALAASTGDGVVVTDADLVVQSWSPGAERETRMTSDDAVGKRLSDIYPDLERSGFAAPFRKTLLERKPQFHEGFYQDGRERYAGWFTISVYPYGAGTISFVRNVSGRKRAELAFQEADSRLKALLDQPAVSFTLKDRNLRYVLANNTAMKTIAQAAGDTIIGKTDPEIYNARVSSLLTSHDRKVLESGSSLELQIALPDGSQPNATWFRIIKQPWRGPDGGVVGVMDVAYDISVQVRAQTESAQRREFMDGLLAEQSRALHKAQEDISRWTK